MRKLTQMAAFVAGRSLASPPFTRYITTARLPVTSIQERGENGRQTLYYHLLASTSLNTDIPSYKWALSYFPEPPNNGSSEDRSVLGALPAHQVSTSDASSDETLGPVSIADFTENPHFVETLHQAIRVVLANDEDPTIKADAQTRREGWMHVCGW